MTEPLMQIGDFIRFIERHRPGYSGRIAPALDYQIEDLVESSRRQLPALYLAYMRTMGGDPADFLTPAFNLHPIELFYAAEDHVEPYPRDRFTLMAVHQPQGHEVQMNLYFDFAHAPGAEPAIVQFETVGEPEIAESDIFVMAGSFHELLLSWGSALLCFDDRPFSRTLQFDRHTHIDGQPIDRASTSRSLAGSLGFAPPLPPTAHCWVGECAGVHLRISRLHRPRSDSFFVDIGADDRAEGERVEARLVAHLGDPADTLDLSKHP